MGERGTPKNAFEQPSTPEHNELWSKLESIEDDQEFLKLASELRESGEINNLSKDEQHDLIRRVVFWYSENLQQNKIDSFRGAMMVDRLFMPRMRESYNEPDILDEYAALMPEIWLEHPDAAFELSNLLDQNAQVVNPDVYLDSLGRIIRQPGIRSDAITSAAAGLSYQASFGLLPYLERRLDNIDQLSVDQAASFLTVLDTTAAYGKGWDFSGESSERLNQMLGEFPEKTGSALLRRKAESIIETQQSREGIRFSADDLRDWVKNDQDTFGDVDHSRLDEISDDQLYDECGAVLQYSAGIFKKFLVDKKRHAIEDPYGTSEIEITGINREASTVVPVSSEYFGVYSLSGRLDSLVKREEGQRQYDVYDLRHPGELPMLGISDEMDSEEREHKMQAQRDYAMLLDRDLLDEIEQDYGFSVRELSTREQVWFMASLREYSPEDEKQIMAFTQQFGIDGARAFLSCEYGDGFRKTVLEIGEKFDEETAKKIFSQYGELVITAQSSADELSDSFFEGDSKKPVDQTQIESDLLKRAKDFLEGIPTMDDPKEIEQRLQQFNSDIVVFSSIFRSLYKGKGGQVDFKEMKQTEFGSYIPSEIDPKDKQGMLDLQAENWSKQKPEIVDFVTKGLSVKLNSNNKDSKFFMMKRGQDIMAFIRYDERPDLEPNATIALSLNVRSGAKGSAMGDVMLEQSLQREAKDRTVYGNVFPQLIAGTAYVEKYGLLISDVVELTNDEGETEHQFLLKRNDQANQQYQARQVGVEQSDLIKGHEGLKARQFNVFDQVGVDEFLEVVRQEKKQGQIVTRYFADSKDKNIRYAVFESEIVPDGMTLAA